MKFLHFESFLRAVLFLAEDFLLSSRLAVQTTMMMLFPPFPDFFLILTAEDEGSGNTHVAEEGSTIACVITYTNSRDYW